MSDAKLDRRGFLKTSTVLGSGVLLAASESAAAEDAPPKDWGATPPKGFTRLSLPGKVVKVHRPNSRQPNGAFPTMDAARLMFTRAMTELTGAKDLGAAFAKFVHPDEKVAIKVNGIAGRKTMKMATSKEMVVVGVEGLIAAGVKPENITIFEQYRDFLFATRCIVNRETLELAPEFPKGVKAAVHLNKDATMDHISVGGIPTKYVRPFTDASVVINISQVKDHSICGYTGAMKNITHGCNINPQNFHEHTASPQIAHLYSQRVVKSRVALHIADAYQVIYDEGPIDINPKRRVAHDCVYASTDPVAIDVVGWEVVEKLRKENDLPTLKEVRREPSYLQAAEDLGLGIFDRKRITLETVKL